jgi:RNA polymerase sigma-70 factor (ECF subfamily)
MSTATVVRASEHLGQEFEEVFREHHQLIYRTAYSVTGSRQDAEDVLQTIFVRLLKREFPPDLRNNAKAYLYRAAVNVSLSVLRTRNRQRLAGDIEDLDIPTEISDAGLDDDIQRNLLEAMAQLSPQAVEMLILRYEHNYSDAEIAKMLGKSRGTVAVTMFRARARMKKLLKRKQS